MPSALRFNQSRLDGSQGDRRALVGFPKNVDSARLMGGRVYEIPFDSLCGVGFVYGGNSNGGLAGAGDA